ncbi:MAG: histidine phosphatase family protein [Xanthomonadales bacterium]|nr:histidine phosphatase family protein [Xanthomonadales bacterium]NIX11598.1 histidine phosphatase family protein [Xanthomonadales bacterium]
MTKTRDRQSLYLLRHAYARPWRPGDEDFHRPLNQQGLEHMSALADWMGAHLSEPGVILCSPATRTRETAVPVSAAWPGHRPAVQYRKGIYEATAGTLHALVDSAFCEANRVLLVGHNPGLENLVTGITRDADAAAATQLTPGTLVVVEFERGWERDAGQGRLRYWIRRRDLGEPG